MVGDVRDSLWVELDKKYAWGWASTGSGKDTIKVSSTEGSTFSLKGKGKGKYRLLLLEETVNRLSYGEKQRVSIARACIKWPQILLADEPTSAQDTENKRRIMELFREMNESGTIIIMNTHDTDNYRYATDQYVMEKGKIHHIENG